MMMSVDNRQIQTLSRKSYTIEEIEDLLLSYHFKFKKYFNSIIQEIMPQDYKDEEVNFLDYMNTILDMDAVLNNK